MPKTKLPFKTGLGLEDLADELKKGSGGGFDPEQIALYDGDQMSVTPIGGVDSWSTFDSHYVQGGKGQGGYFICSGDGCVYCDAGNRASKRTMMLVYVHSHYRAARRSNGQDYKASRAKNVGYRYFIANKETTETLVRIYKRRHNQFDRIFILERTGAGTDTKYDVDRTDDPTSTKIIKGAPRGMSSYKKLTAMYEAEQDSKPSRKKKKSRDEEDDDDMASLGWDFDDKSKSKKSKKSKSRR